MAETVKTCLSCGNELPHDATACPTCGVELGKAEKSEEESRRPFWGGLGCLTVLILFGIAAILIFGIGSGE